MIDMKQKQNPNGPSNITFDPLLASQSSFDRFFSRMYHTLELEGHQQQQATEISSHEEDDEELMLEPSPINTTRMTIVDRLDLTRGPDYARFAANFPFSQLYEPLQAPSSLLAQQQASLGATKKIEDEPITAAHYNNMAAFESQRFLLLEQTHQHMLGATVQVLGRRKNDEEPSTTGDDSSSYDGDLGCHLMHNSTATNAIPAEVDARTGGGTATITASPSTRKIVGRGRDQNHTDRWNDKFTELKSFIRVHGHARVPVRYKSNLPLSKWAKRQRYQWKLKHEGKHSTLSDSREAKLDEVGFLWDIRLTVWEERFEELYEFRKKHGHCNVPISCAEYPKLGTWVKCQRRQWKLRYTGQQSSMTPSRIAKLEGIGFSWEAR